jgi:hypothetical protein
MQLSKNQRGTVAYLQKPFPVTAHWSCPSTTDTAAAAAEGTADTEPSACKMESCNCQLVDALRLPEAAFMETAVEGAVLLPPESATAVLLPIESATAAQVAKCVRLVSAGTASTMSTGLSEGMM